MFDVCLVINDVWTLYCSNEGSGACNILRGSYYIGNSGI